MIDRVATGAGRGGPVVMSSPGSSGPSGCALAVFASRESADELEATLRSALAAATPGMAIDVLINGNAGLAQRTLQDIAPHLPTTTAAKRLRVWSIALGDKSNAWNRYLHDIWAGEPLAFFIDGYVRLMPEALARLGQSVLADDRVLGGSGLKYRRGEQPIGSQVVHTGGFHGNFCCIKARAVEEFRRQGIYLPTGLYRGDALIGALLLYGMDPVTGGWSEERTLTVPQARYLTDDPRWWRWKDLRAALKRRWRQAQGVLENQAVRSHLTLCKRPPAQLAPTARELVLHWAEEFPAAFRSTCLRSPLGHFAYRRLLASVPDDTLRAGREASLLWSSAD